MIRFGIAGIPLSSKGRTLYDGVKDAHNLGLRALEVQFLRINSFEREVFREEEGLSAQSLSGVLVTEVHTNKTGDWNSGRFALHHPLERGETLRLLSIPIASDYQKLNFIGSVARELDVSLSIHTPHYMELTSTGKAGEDAMRWLKWAALLGDALGATHVATYLGIYGDDPDESLDNVIDNLKMVRNWMKRNKIRMKLGVETSGWQDVLGSTDEILEICSKVPNTRPVLNFGHIHSREGGSLNTKDDFQAIFDMTKKYAKDGHYMHFTGVEHSEGYERQYTPIKRGDLKFEPLAEAILENSFDVTIISSSPLIEHDAIYMKILVERQMLKRYNKKKEKKDEKKQRSNIKKDVKAQKKPVNAARKSKRVSPDKSDKKAQKKVSGKKVAKQPEKKKEAEKPVDKKKAKTVPVKKKASKGVGAPKKKAEKPSTEKSPKKSGKKKAANPAPEKKPAKKEGKKASKKSEKPVKKSKGAKS